MYACMYTYMYVLYVCIHACVHVCIYLTQTHTHTQTQQLIDFYSMFNLAYACAVSDSWLISLFKQTLKVSTAHTHLFNFQVAMHMPVLFNCAPVTLGS